MRLQDRPYPFPLIRPKRVVRPPGKSILPVNAHDLPRVRRRSPSAASSRLPTLAGFLWGAALWALPVAAQETGGVQLTLEEAVSEALVRSPALAQSESSLRSAEEGRRTALGSFLPSLSVSSGTSRSSTDRFDPATNRTVSGSSESYNLGLNSGVELFTGFRRGAELDRAGSEVVVASSRLDDQRYQVILQTRTLFFQGLRQSDLLEVARTRLQRAEESLASTRRRAEVGSGTRSDTLRARLELQNARQAVLTSETAVRNARLNLARQVGSDLPVIPVRPANLDPVPLALGEAEILALAEEGSPGVRSAIAETEAAGATVRSSRSGYLPSLRVSSGYTWSNDAPIWDSGRTGWNVGLSASYPVFNGFVREANVARAVNALRVAGLQEEDARRAARVQADAALRAVETAEAAIGLARESVLVAEEDFRVVQQRFELGVATILDLITSQIALDQAQTDLVTARYDYAIARSELEAVVGRAL